MESIAVNHLLERLLPNLMPWVIDPLTYRVDRLYTEQCDMVMRKHKRSLLHIFISYATIGPKRGRHFMKLRDFTSLFNELHWLDELFTREQLKHSFVSSQMLSIDEMRTKRFMLLSLVDFMEAVARLLTCCSDKIHPRDGSDIKRDSIMVGVLSLFHVLGGTDRFSFLFRIQSQVDRRRATYWKLQPS